MVMPSDLIMRLYDQYTICLVNAVGETVLVPNNIIADIDDCNQITANNELGSSEVEDNNDGKDDSEIVCLNVDDVDNKPVDHSCAAMSQLQHEQFNDSSLKGAWSLAKLGKGLYFLRDDLLFRCQKV